MRSAPPGRHAALLDAACAVICEQGADRLRLQDVADRAGVSRALLHYHFDSREDLLRRAFDHAEDAAERLVAAAVARGATPVERLELLLGAYLEDDAAVRVSWLVTLELRRAARLDPTFRPAVETSHRGWLLQIVDGLVACGVDAAEARDPAERLCALVDGLGEQRLSGHLDAARARVLLHGAVTAEVGLPAAARHAGAP